MNKNGLLGFINPHKFFNSNYGKNLRNLIIDNKSINQIIHFDDYQIFDNATTYTCLLFLQKEKNKSFKAIKLNSKTFAPQFLNNDLEFLTLEHEDWLNKDWNITKKSDNKLLGSYLSTIS